MTGNRYLRLAFWLIATAGIFAFAISSYRSGEMVRWYYYEAKEDGYAINDQTFLRATKQNPVYLTIAGSEEISGAMAVPVKKGELLPKGANGVIATTSVTKGDRVSLDGSRLKMMVPTEVKEDKGIQYLDSYKHKNIATNPWSGVWNVAVILAMGLCLGMLAQAVTDFLGLKYKKIEHHQPHEAAH